MSGRLLCGFLLGFLRRGLSGLLLRGLLRGRGSSLSGRLLCGFLVGFLRRGLSGRLSGGLSGGLLRGLSGGGLLLGLSVSLLRADSSLRDDLRRSGAGSIGRTRCRLSNRFLLGAERDDLVDGRLVDD